MEEKIIKSMNIRLISALIQTAITITLIIIINVTVPRPLWIMIIASIPIPLMLAVTYILVRDLLSRDYITIQGCAIAKEFNKLYILDDQGRKKKLRLRDEFMKHIEDQDLIEVKLFRRSKVVVSIQKLNL